MSPIIPFSGLISDILAIVSLLARWGGPLFGWVIGLWLLKTMFAKSLADEVKSKGLANISKGPLLAAGLAQDALIVVCILALTR